jgi:hypothetical protein
MLEQFGRVYNFDALSEWRQQMSRRRSPPLVRNRRKLTRLGEPAVLSR